MTWSYIDWAEKAATENLRERLATGDTLLAQANTLLNLLLVGMAGSLAWGVKVFTPGAVPVEWGAAAVSVWLAGVSAVLVAKCVRTRPTQTLFNEPAHLYQPALGLDETAIRAFELENVQARINLTKTRNRIVASWLDHSRYAAAATPVVFGIAALVAALAAR